METQKTDGAIPRSGRTTRIIDALIQELFANGQVCVEDHPTQDGSRANVASLRRIGKAITHRLQHEHGLSYGTGYTYDGSTFTFKLVKR